jgi:dephospho-CoA kinase
MVRHAEKRFLMLARRHGARAAVLDIALLFESRRKDKSRERVDLSVAVSAPLAEQIARVRRRGFAPLEIAKIIAVQMPDHEKRRLADVVIRTGLSRAETRRAVSRLVRKYL